MNAFIRHAGNVQTRLSLSTNDVSSHFRPARLPVGIGFCAGPAASQSG
jgi:hypothetical protein